MSSAKRAMSLTDVLVVGVESVEIAEKEAEPDADEDQRVRVP